MDPSVVYIDSGIHMGWEFKRGSMDQDPKHPLDYYL